MSIPPAIRRLTPSAALVGGGVLPLASDDGPAKKDRSGELAAAVSPTTATTAVPHTVATEAPTARPATTTTMPTTTTTESKTWVAVGSLTGSTGKLGSPFHLNGGQQRITWKCQGTGGGGCFFYVKKVGSSSSYGGWTTSTTQNTNDTSQAYMTADEYHLAVDVLGSWVATMSIEELR